MSENVTKSELVDRIQESTKLDQKDILSVIDSLLLEIKDSLKKNDTVELRGFGTFKTKYSQRTSARNPLTGEKVAVTPHYKAVFVPGKDLQDSLGKNE